MEAILDETNLKEAIKKVKENTAPGRDGIPAEAYRASSEEIVHHLQDLYKSIFERGELTEDMCKSTTTMAYKGKGIRERPKYYRPIAVTNVDYRILATAMVQRLAMVIHKMVGDSQIGFQLMRDIGENIELMTEAIRYANEEASGEGGAVAILDNAHAYDRWSKLPQFDSGCPHRRCRE